MLVSSANLYLNQIMILFHFVCLFVCFIPLLSRSFDMFFIKLAFLALNMLSDTRFYLIFF